MQTADKFMLRLPDGLRDTIRIRAVLNRRTMNAEILFAIDRLLADDAKSPTGTAIPAGLNHD